MQGGTSIDGLLVGGRTSGPGGFELLALDVDTGTVRWTTPVHLPTAHLTPQGTQPTSLVGCTPVRARRPPARGCVPSSSATTSWGSRLRHRGSWTRPTARSLPTPWCRGDGRRLRGDAPGRRRPDRGGRRCSCVRRRHLGPLAGDGVRPRLRRPPVDLHDPRVDVLPPDDDRAVPPPPVPRRSRCSATGWSSAWTRTRGSWATTGAWCATSPSTRDPGSRARAAACSSRATTPRQTRTTGAPAGDGSPVPTDESAGWLSVDDGSAPGRVHRRPGTHRRDGLSARDATTGGGLAP